MKKWLKIILVLIAGLTLAFVAPVYLLLVSHLLDKPEFFEPVRNTIDGVAVEVRDLQKTAEQKESKSRETVTLDAKVGEPSSRRTPPTTGTPITLTQKESKEIRRVEVWTLPASIWRISCLAVTGFIVMRILRTNPNQPPQTTATSGRL